MPHEHVYSYMCKYTCVHMYTISYIYVIQILPRSVLVVLTTLERPELPAKPRRRGSAPSPRSSGRPTPGPSDQQGYPQSSGLVRIHTFCVYIYIYTYIYIHAPNKIHLQVYVYTNVFTYIYTHVHTVCC